MVRAWYLDEKLVAQNKSDPCLTEENVTLDDLLKIGFDADEYENNEEYNSLKKKRGYSYQDNITINRCSMPNYDEMTERFFKEHIHQDEEIRFILDGCGYFDVRDTNDRWIRVEVTKNDLLVLPPGIYHRFAIDNSDYIKVIRLFQGEPVWTAFFRPADDFEERKNYTTKYYT
ncbi:unnamed protein product [Clavelina lepadiformis]|uniref:Acireductone dioxygenase n=1 Tax=Clavelina lepadiformis TaxID=159417 RepID=A0ABP0G3D5_CLALP